MFSKNLFYQMEITKKIFSLLLVLLPVTLITGPAIPDITITFSSIFFLIYLIYHNNIKLLVNNGWFNAAIIFWIYILISSIFAFNFSNAFSNSLIFLRYIIIPMIILHFVFENIFLRKLLIVLIFCSILFVIIDTFYQFLNYDSFNGFKSDLFGYIPDFAKYNRLTGPFKDLVPGAYVSKFSFFGLVFFIIYFKNLYLRNILILVYLSICGYITFISGERMAFASYGLGLILFFLFNKKNRMFNFLSILLMFILIFCSYKLHPSYNDFKIVEVSSIENGLLVEKEYTCDESIINKCNHLARLQPPFIEILKDFKHSAYGEIYSLALEMYKNNYIFGIGLNNFEDLCKTEQYKNILNNIGCVTHPHNIYLQWLVETGPAGLVLFIIFLIYLFLYVIRNKDHTGKLISLISLIILLWPIMSTGSLVKNWMGISTFFAIGLAVSMHKLKLDD